MTESRNVREEAPGASSSSPTVSGLASTDTELAELLGRAKSIAVVGIKNDPAEDAQRVPAYMQQHGYRILPVNPKLSSALGSECRASVRDIEEPVDIVNLFRASNHIEGHVDEILALDPKPGAVWMQLGIHHGPAAAKLRAAGIDVIQDRCIMVEHRRLLGKPAPE